MSDPYLTLDTRPSLTIITGAPLSSCCNGNIDCEGRCAQCELAAPAITSHVCSSCGEHVSNITADADTALLECHACGARWTAVNGDLGTEHLNGLAADGWNPAKTPPRFADYLQSYSGRTEA